MVHQNPPHDLSRNMKEDGPSAPFPLPLLHQPDVRLVDQRRSLKGVSRGLRTQVPGGEQSQFAIDERDEAFERMLLPVRRQLFLRMRVASFKDVTEGLIVVQLLA